MHFPKPYRSVIVVAEKLDSSIGEDSNHLGTISWDWIERHEGAHKQRVERHEGAHKQRIERHEGAMGNHLKLEMRMYVCMYVCMYACIMNV